MKGKEIYLLWDMKMGSVEGATTNHKEAEKMTASLNEMLGKGMRRYKVITLNDFADKQMG